ncbi:MAG: hypothetical protein IPK82_39995 [Polyangiaceae bacterium]|nr:hypothetical protein [Polyangiaceae bacterium]
MRFPCRGFAGVAAAVLFGCSGAPKEPPVGPPTSGNSAATVPSSATFNGSTLLAADAAVAVRAGAGPLRVLTADILSEGDRLGQFVDVPENECLLVFARPSPTVRDVDLFAFEDDGSPFSTDESPNQGGTILVCPPHARRLYLLARVMAGMGLVALGTQAVPQKNAEAVAQAVRARGRPGEDTGRLDAWPGLEAKIREHRVAVGGVWQDVRRVAVPVTPRASSRISVAIGPHRCADILIAPSEEIASLDAVLEDQTGRIIGRTRERGGDRSAVVCSTVATEVSLAMRPRAAEGLVAVVIGWSAPGAVAEVAQSVSTFHATEPRDLADATKNLENVLSSLNFAAPKTAANARASVGQRTTVSLDLPAGCVRIDLVGGKPLGTFRADLWDDQNSLVTQTYGGARGTFFSCGKGGTFRTDVEALDAPGPFAVSVRKDKSAPAALVAHPVAASRLLGRLEAAGVPIDASSAKDAVIVSLDASSLKTQPFSVLANTCVEVLAAVDNGALGVDLRLVDLDSQESTLARGATCVSNRLCAGASAKPGKIELRLTSGKADGLLLMRTQSP